MWYDDSQRQPVPPALCKRLSYFRKLPRAIRQYIVDIWRAGIRDRSLKVWRIRWRPTPIRLGIYHDPRWCSVRNAYRWPGMRGNGPGKNAVATYNAEHSYAYGGNPGHYVLTTPSQYNGFDTNAAWTHERDDRGTNMTDTFGNTLTKLIEYRLPGPPSRYSGTDEVLAQNLRLRRIRRVRWVDRMI
jgi:hypothetical protein